MASNNAGTIAVVVTGGVVALAVLSVFGGSFYSVDQGERAVITRMGAVVGISEPGFHWKTPFVEGAHKISLRSTSADWKEMPSYSQDQQAAVLQVTVTWHADASQVEKIYNEYGDLEGLSNQILMPRVPQATKEVFGQFNAAKAISDRTRLNTEVAERIEKSVLGTPVIVEAVAIRNIDFSDAYEHAIEERMRAEVDALQAEQAAKKTVTEANAEAQSKLALRRAEAEGNFLTADAQARGINALAEAEANRLRQRGAALRDNPQLIELTTAETWDGKLPTQMIPGSAVPFLNVAQIPR